jgi:2-polyprenyl-3-methyl-5-hydroxy-6-metoxy-1,4-benzoquinol methylase
MVERTECCVCNSNDLAETYEAKNIPIKLSCTYDKNFLYNELCISQCKKCNTFQLTNLVPLNVLYGDSHNHTSVGKVWENYFHYFIQLITPIVENKNILEIGDPSGKIANRLDNYKKWTIIEPNKNKNITFNEKVEFIESYFDANTNINQKFDCIIHSHFFEHIYEYDSFLIKCHELLTDEGQVFFGVPNMEHIASNGIAPFLGIFFEHTVFLNKENIQYLFNKNGFNLIETYDYLSHSTLYHFKKMEIFHHLPEQIKIKNHYDQFFTTLQTYMEFIHKTNSIISTKKKYLFGASYNTQFLLALGLKDISGIIDNCEEKQNKYFYGYDLLVYPPTVLDSNSIVIIKNGYYSNEIIVQIRQINDEIEIIS